MHAWLCETTTGPQDLVWRELPTPEPAADEVRIKIRAASINFPDLLTVVGKYQIRPKLPFVPGSEFAGTVDAVGSGVGHLKPGMPVAAIGSSGGFGTHACVKAANVIPLPPGFKLEDAAAFAFTYGTSHHALLDRGQLQAGETVLVLGAAGGVGTAAVQIAKAAGAKVIAAASTDDKCAACLAIGADDVINYGRQSLRDELKALTGGRGPDIVYDPVGGDLAEQAFRAIAWRGRYLVVGFAAGGIPALPFNLPLLKGASVVGVFWGDHVRREPAANAQALGQLARWYGEGKIKPVIDTLLPMSELATAYRRMAERDIKGKLVMVNAD
ncbi:MAG: NADPH:quinone oxidoreductase family protein [Burkholderiaceae bacterium]